MKIPLIWLKDYVQTDKSAKELAHSFTQLGLMLDKPLDDKNILDLEHRMDRADWLSILGCARDLAAFEGLPLTLPKGHTKPGKTLSPRDQIEVKVNTPAVNRFQTRVFKGITVGPSPSWLVERLLAYGLDSINNIVDITNFVMIEYGQPMHAQDIAKMKGSDITLRQARAGEKLTTLLGTQITLDDSAFVLTSGGEATVIGGIVGGHNTGVSNTTTDIVLDAGNYDSKIIRSVSRKLKIINETVSRYDKFLDPRTIDFALDRATKLILELAGGTYYNNSDYCPAPKQPQTQTLRLSRLQLLSGMAITLSTAKTVLKSLGYIVVDETSHELTLEIPYFRTDIEVEDDLIADILRIGDYLHIPQIPLSSPVPSDITPPLYLFEERLRDLMVAQGAHEHITSSLITSTGETSEITLANALSSEQNALRTQLVKGLNHVVANYHKHKISGVPVFEIGKVFHQSSGSYQETRELTAVFHNYQATSTSLATLLSSLGILDFQIDHDHQIVVKGQIVGHQSEKHFQLNTLNLMPLTHSYTGIVSEFSHTTTHDLSLLSPTKVVYADIIQALSSLKANWLGLVCKSLVQINSSTNNYLLSITWDASAPTIQADKEKILYTLSTKLKIKSTS